MIFLREAGVTCRFSAAAVRGQSRTRSVIKIRHAPRGSFSRRQLFYVALWSCLELAVCCRDSRCWRNDSLRLPALVCIGLTFADSALDPLERPADDVVRFGTELYHIQISQ